MRTPSIWSAFTWPPAGQGTADYINCPMNREEFDRFLDALLAAEPAEAREWEKLEYFEGCLPIEVLAAEAAIRSALVHEASGLRDPRTGRTPWAVVQLRRRIYAPQATTWSASRTISSSRSRLACCA